MAAPTEKQHAKKFNKKRKKTFLDNARGMGKKGKFGHGSQLDEETYSYFVRVLELFRGDFDTPEEKEALVLNALVETEGKEVLLSSNQVGCRALETLISQARTTPQGISALLRFMDVFASNLRVVTVDRFASHVLQSLLTSVTKYGIEGYQSKSETENSNEETETLLSPAAALDWVLKVAKFILNNLDEFVWNEYANFVIRTVLECLTGSPPCGNDSNWNSYQKQHNSNHGAFTSLVSTEENDKKTLDHSVPDSFSDVIKEYHNRIISMPQFSDFPYSNTTSALIQTLLKVLSATHPKLTKTLIKQLIDQVFTVQDADNEDKKDSVEKIGVPSVFTTSASIRLLEAALEHAVPKHVMQIYAMCFMGHLVVLAKDHATNFSVQKLLAKVEDKNEFEFISDELAPGLGELVANGKGGVILAFCQACKRLSTKQGFFIENLMRALDCFEPEDRHSSIALSCLKMCTFDNLKAKEIVFKDRGAVLNLNLHGSLVIQTLLRFNKPMRIVNSILETNSEELKKILCDKVGSHIMDAFMTSESVGEKSREKMVHKLQGFYVEMACSTHGSRALEALYTASSIKNQMIVMEELANRVPLVTGSWIGGKIAKKWRLDLFCRSRKEWVQLQSRKKHSIELFSDIIQPKPSS